MQLTFPLYLIICCADYFKRLESHGFDMFLVLLPDGILVSIIYNSAIYDGGVSKSNIRYNQSSHLVTYLAHIGRHKPAKERLVCFALLWYLRPIDWCLSVPQTLSLWKGFPSNFTELWTNKGRCAGPNTGALQVFVYSGISLLPRPACVETS